MTTQSDHLWYADPWTSGDRFLKARQRTGLDQDDFAELIEASRQTVSNYETNTTQHHVRAIVGAWALATGTTSEWLLHGDTPSEVPSDSTYTPQYPTGDGLAKVYRFPEPRRVDVSRSAGISFR